MIIGYTTGVYDLFHVGHVNLLRNSKALCDKLIVGVTVDELVSYKNKKSVIPYVERIEVVRACRYVDVAIPQTSIDKVEAARKIGANILFVGDDWYADPKWNKMQEDLSSIGCQVKYFPYTQGTSSTLINETLNRLRSDL
ncbi:adenylyltransferase/cytidyltransferase family protein [Novosphingobium arvoryzae]|uniref:adenylyltransferase/cytidyltransferase family protein n=1 Tax=Novosphingobium arvoryzae TaxID=1256514 RepID=UPI0035AFE1BD